MKKAIVAVVGMIVIVVAIYYGWQAERWVNWKFGYKAKLDARLVSVELRLDELENAKVKR